MKIKGKLTFKSEHAGELVRIIAQSLAPDNVSEMETFIGKDSATVSFSADKVGTMLSCVDDYLMNARIAKDIQDNTQKIY
jgi:hypothetical protein